MERFCPHTSKMKFDAFEWDEDPKDDGDYADPEVEGVEEYEDE